MKIDMSCSLNEHDFSKMALSLAERHLQKIEEDIEKEGGSYILTFVSDYLTYKSIITKVCTDKSLLSAISPTVEKNVQEFWDLLSEKSTQD